MDDVISRQQAINNVERAKIHVSHSVERAIGRGIIEILDELEKNIRGLPSAQPKRGKWIDRGEHGDWEWQADGRGNQPFPSLLPPHKDYRQQRHRCTME